MGLYKFRLELLQRLINENNQVSIIVPFGEFIDKIINTGCKVIDCEISRHGKNPFQDLRLLNTYKKILRVEKPDIVFTYTIKPNIYGGMACKSLKIPYVVNITGLGTAVENGGLLQKLTLFLYKKGINKARKVFFQNAENRDFMLKHKIVKDNFDLLPGSGVNLDKYQVLEYPKTETINFVFISRIMKEKGIDQFLEMAQYIKNKYPNTSFHVCGSCEQNYEEQLKNLHKQGIIIYHGLVKGIEKIHEISSCTVHPTYYPEGISNVLLESAACARPIITTNRAGCREVIDDGKNGFIVRQKDSKDLIEKVEKFLSLSYEERKQMGLNGRQKVEKEFNRQIVINKYLGEL